jgi:hypothetical protein
VLTRAAMPGVGNTTVDALPELVASSGVTTLAVIGLAKNAGKTTAINALLGGCPRPLGLTSLGLDGESTDHLTGLAKPRIAPPAGTIVATTSGSLQRSRYDLEILERLPFRTPLGPVVVGRASGRGRVEVSGPTTLAELGETVRRLHAHGARLVLVDGAINRLGSASPIVSDGVLLATGGIVGETLDEVVEATAATVDLLTIPEAPRADRDALASLLAGGASLAVLDASGRRLPLAAETTVAAGASLAREVAALSPATLVVGGAVTEQFLDDLARVLPPRARVRIVVRDATALITRAQTVTRCLRRGISLEAITALSVLAVTTNPFRMPRPYPARVLFDAVVAAVGDRLPVFDVLSGFASLPPRRAQLPPRQLPTEGG